MSEPTSESESDFPGTGDAIREVTRDLASARDVGGLLHRIAALSLVGAEVSAVYLERVDFEQDQVEVIATAGTAAPTVGARIPYPGSLAAEVLEHDQPEVVGFEVLATRPVAGTIPEACRRCDALVVPLVSEAQPLGALILLRPRKESPFTSEEISRTRALGDLAALMLRRVLLGEQVERGRVSLRASEERFRLLVQSVRDYAIFMLDPDGRVASWNEGAERIKGYREQQIVGEHFSRFYTEEDRERDHPAAELAAARRDGVYREEGWRIRRDGSRFWAYVTITALWDETGTLVGFAKVTRDLTERRAAEQEREQLLLSEREARVEAERANRAKSQFLGTMSHELHTPINAILGYTDLLDSEIAGPVTPLQRSYLDRVRTSSRHLLGLVGDVLDLARIEAERVELSPQVLRVDHAIRAALELVQPQADAKGLEVLEACGDEVQARADPDRLRQVLVNLVGNAVKFTERGRITVTCGPVDGPAHGATLEGPGPWALIRVEDTGVGIPPDRIADIWKPFEQAETGHSRPKDGAGLGLTISRSLARLMGGDLVAHSEPGTGSSFLLFLPAAGAGDAAERRDGARHTPGIGGVGHAVFGEIERILDAYVTRLRTDPEVPSAVRMSDAELEDHAATMLADIAEALGAIDAAAGAPSAVVRDSQAVQQLLAKRHGQRRALRGWRPAELRRDYRILREEVERAVRRRVERASSGGDVDAAALDDGLALLAQFLERAERISLEEMEDA